MSNRATLLFCICLPLLTSLALPILWQWKQPGVQDLRPLALHLELIPPIVDSLFLLDSDENAFRGEALYREHCLACHGSEGEGNGYLAGHLRLEMPDFTNPYERWRQGSEPEQIFITLKDGMTGSAMVAYYPALRAREIWYLTHYLARFAGPKRRMKEPMHAWKARDLSGRKEFLE